MYSHIVNESLITSIINNREYNNDEKIKSILQLLMLIESPESKQIINDQAKLISAQQKLIEVLQENKKNENENGVKKNDLIDFNDKNAGLKPLYKVFIGQLPQSIPIVQIKNHLNEIFGHVDSVYQLIPESNYGFALFSNYDSCQKAISRGSVKIQDKSFFIHNAHDRD